MTCPHSRKRSIVIFLSEGTLHRAALTIQCADCGTPFEFVDPPAGELSADRRQLRLAIAPAVDGTVQ